MTTSPAVMNHKELIVAFIEQQYQLTGDIPSAEKAYAEFGIPIQQYADVLTDSACRKALEEKGIVFARLEGDDWTSKTLTPRQLMVANTLLDLTDSRSQKKKLQDLKVHTQTYTAWLKDPVFKDYLKRRAEQLLGDNEHEVTLALLDQIRAGNLKALMYYNEMTGKYVPQRANQSNVDVGNVLTKVIEIIIEEVDDQETAVRISNRLRAMVSARNVAGALLGAEEEPIAVPEIVKVRQLEE